MKQVMIAAWVGIITGWMGFGWALAEAPADGIPPAQIAVAEPVGEVFAAVDILQEPVVTVRGTIATEPNLRG